MPRSVVAGFTAILVFFLGCLAYLYVVTSAGPAKVAPVFPELSRPPAPEATIAPAVPRRTVGASIAPGEPEDRVPAAAPPSAPAAAPEDRNLREGVPSRRRAALSSFRRELIAGVSLLRAQVAACGRDGEEAMNPGASGLARTEFTLSLETTVEGIRIVDARVLARGDASEAQLACARSHLAGRTLSAPSAQPGHAWEMPFACR